MNYHGEAGANSDKEYQKIINNWKPVLWDEIIKKKINLLHIYNGNQLGLFYSKLTNCVYVLKEKAKEMLYTAEGGEKIPISVIVNSKKPHFFPPLR